MAIALVTKSYGTINAGATLIVTDVYGNPATILTTATGGVISTSGRFQLDTSGNASFYTDTAVYVNYTVLTNAPKITNAIYATMDPQNSYYTTLNNPAAPLLNPPNYILSQATNGVRGVAGISTPLLVSGAVTLTSAYEQLTLDCAASTAITVPATGLGAGFHVKLLMPTTGSVTIVSDGTSTFNGATTTLTKSITTPIVSIYQHNTVGQFAVA